MVSTRITSLEPTSSKKVFAHHVVALHPPLINHCNQTDTAIKALSLTTPTKPSKKVPLHLIDDRRHSVSPDTVDASSEPTEEVDELEEFRKMFVGEVDLPESESYVPRVIQHILINAYSHC
jgi:hypothetical protein